MRKLVSRSLALLAMGILVSLGSQAPARAAGGNHPLQKMAAALDLSGQQIAQIKVIMKAARSQSVSVKANASLSAQQKRADLKQIHRQAMQQINSILTPAQQQKWAAIRASQRAARKNAAAGQATTTVPPPAG